MNIREDILTSNPVLVSGQPATIYRFLQSSLMSFHRVFHTYAARVPAAPADPVRTMPCEDRYELNVATRYCDRPDILAAWRRLLAAATGPEPLYQSPQFFRYLTDMASGRDADYELLVVRRTVDGDIVGVVPVRVFGCTLDFRFGSLPLLTKTMHACQILGSVPLLDPAAEGLTEFVMEQLLKRYTKCAGLYMQAFPQEMAAALPSSAAVASHVLHGWRACHTQPLQDSVEAYLQAFSSKKRYNLSRQIRLLTEAAGALQVVRVEGPGQVAALVDAMVAIDPSRGGDRDAEQRRLACLARHGLLLSYVIRCGDEAVAVVLGSRSSSVWHVHRIFNQRRYLQLSVGTSAVHLALQDVLAHFSFAHVDYGYGMPNAEFRTTHVLKSRGTVLLHRARSGIALLLKLHGTFDAMNDVLIRQAKRAKTWYAQRRQVARKTAAAA